MGLDAMVETAETSVLSIAMVDDNPPRQRSMEAYERQVLDPWTKGGVLCEMHRILGQREFRRLFDLTFDRPS